MIGKISRITKSKNKKILVCLTAYSKPISKILDNYCDLVLVGDSLATAMYGMKNTHHVSIETMIQHGVAVSSNLKKAVCVVDMPINSYIDKKIAKKNAMLIFKKTKCDAVKIECNGKNFDILKSIVEIGIPVMGHIGFTPQNYKNFKAQGLVEKERIKLIDQAIKIEKAGAFSLVLECVNKSVAKDITKILKIPTIGIGASNYCDGQILVTDDMLGLSGFYPRFVRKFARLDNIIEKSIQKYKKAVLNKNFPSNKNNY